jgi:hypothetical protein
MQQLFLVPQFRYGILLQRTTDALAAVDESAALTKTKPKYPEVDDNITLMYQFQHIFAYLQESRRKAYDAKSFCLVQAPRSHATCLSISFFIL